jgi:anti-anti-sigma factor
MPLHIDPRYVGDVCVLECRGSIVIGPEIRQVEAALQMDGKEFNRIVVVVRKVDRLDSIGLGLIVRTTDAFRKRGGDLRLADAPQFMAQLLAMTKLDGFLNLYASEEEAVLSYLRQPAAEQVPSQPGRRVLVIDRSPEIGALVRTILTQHGYQVKTVSLVSDARMLLRFEQVDYILFGRATTDSAVQSGSAALRPLAPQAVPLSLTAEFATCDACDAAEMLLDLFEAAHPQT